MKRVRYDYRNSDGMPLEYVSLAQSPPNSKFFQLREPIYRHIRGSDAPGEILSPEDLTRTDLASVPHILWNYIAPYGRQTVPALFHDRDSDLAYIREDYAGRRRSDDEFYAGLRSNHVPLLRAWMMWTAVRIQGLWAHGRWRAILLFAHLAAIASLVWAIVSLAEAGASVLFRVLAVLLAAVLAAVAIWGRDAGVVVATIMILPIAVTTILPSIVFLGLFRLIELGVWCVDKRFIDREADSVVEPTGIKNRIGTVVNLRAMTTRGREDTP